MASNSPLDPTNLLILPATFGGNIRWADSRRGPREFLPALIGLTGEPFFVPVKSGWTEAHVRALLWRYGIRLWGVGYWWGEMYFRVKRRQAHWAQYVMLRAGVPLLHGYLPGSRAIPR
jgi:hypothetical protein